MPKTINSLYGDNSNAKLEKNHNSRFFIGRYTDKTPTDTLLHHYHDCFELYYLYSGERYYFIQDKTYHITKGSFVLINPYEIHRTGNLGNFGFDRMLIHFDRELLEDYLEMDGSLYPYKSLDEQIHIITLDAPEQNFVETLLSSMESEYRNNHEKENGYIKLSLIQLLHFLNSCRHSTDGESLTQITSTQKTMFEILGYINNYYYEEIRLETIASKFFLSTYYLSRSFKEATGFHFVEYLNNVRIKESKKLLLTSDLSIDEIAAMVGYKSNTHFGRVFKSLEGMSPSAFRDE